MDFERMRRFQEHLVNWRIPGNDCMIRQGHKILYRYQAGFRDVESRLPMAGDELYFFWSGSKVITTSLALRLHEEGAFLMSDPLSRYLPEFGQMTVRRMVDGKEEIVPAKNPITVGHLFNMTAGLDYNFNTPAVVKARKDFDGRCPTREIVRAIAKSPLSFEPGEHWQYSLCHDVLGGLVEVLAGKRLRDYAREVLFDPLGMTDTTYNLPSADKMERLATQYNFRDDLGTYVHTNNTCGHILGPDYDSGGAGIVSTCEDYMKFADTLACGGTSENGYRYLSPHTIRLWRTNTLSETQRRDFNWEQFRGYGYGFGVRTLMDSVEGSSLSPVGEFGWGGAAGMQVIIDPDNRLSLVYMQHMLNSQEVYLFPRLRNVLYGCME